MDSPESFLLTYLDGLEKRLEDSPEQHRDEQLLAMVSETCRQHADMMRDRLSLAHECSTTAALSLVDTVPLWLAAVSLAIVARDRGKRNPETAKTIFSCLRAELTSTVSLQDTSACTR